LGRELVVVGGLDKAEGGAMLEIGEGRMLRSNVLLNVLRVVGVAVAMSMRRALPVFEPAVP
jgi:hypothetical protein